MTDILMPLMCENINARDLQNKSEHAKRTLNHYLFEWDKTYNDQIQTVELFDTNQVKLWTDQQKKSFVSVFYHLRGHFSDFLWYMGSFAPNESAKKLIIRNIMDEFNYQGYSHDQLYLHFASAFDVDLKHELIDNHHYAQFAKAYIDGQLRWLRDHTWEERLAAFAAIERLDNIDYLNFKNVAINMGAAGSHLTFFNVHISADHFESILNNHLINLWKENEDLVKNVFEFILEYQNKMLTTLSDYIKNQHQ